MTPQDTYLYTDQAQAWVVWTITVIAALFAFHYLRDLIVFILAKLYALFVEHGAA